MPLGVSSSHDTGVVLSTVNPSEMGKMFSYNGRH